MTAPFNLAAIRQKVRNLTARTSTDQITDTQINQFINTYYLYDMPESLRLLKLKDVYTFTTVPNQEVYQIGPVPGTVQNTQYITFEPPAYVGGQQVNYFQDLDMFYRQWPKIDYIQLVATGNGTTGPYTGTITGKPFLRSVNVTTPANPINARIGRDVNVIFSGISSANGASVPTTSTITDDGNGGLIDLNGNALVGTVNYTTGAFTINFPAAITSGQQINASVIPYVASLPRSICFYQNQFFMRPVPDKAYIVQIDAFRYPTDLLLDNDNPELNFWWQLLAYGAALKILVENADFQNAEAFRPYYEEQLLLVQRRTIKQQTNQRAATIYDNGASFPYSNLYPYI